MTEVAGEFPRFTLLDPPEGLSRVVVRRAVPTSMSAQPAYQVAAEGNLTTLLHGKAEKALTLHVEDVGQAVEVYAGAIEDVVPWWALDPAETLLTRVDASATWAISPVDVGQWVSAADARNAALKGCKVPARYGSETASVKVSAKHYERVYNKGLEAFGMPGSAASRKGAGDRSSPVLSAAREGETGLVRGEVTYRGDKARELYGRTLRGLSETARWAVSTVEDLMASVSVYGGEVPEGLVVLAHFARVADTPGQAARLAGLYPVWKTGGVRALRPFAGSRETAGRLARDFRRFGDPDPSPLPELEYAQAVMAGRD